MNEKCINNILKLIYEPKILFYFIRILLDKRLKKSQNPYNRKQIIFTIFYNQFLNFQLNVIHLT